MSVGIQEGWLSNLFHFDEITQICTCVFELYEIGFSKVNIEKGAVMTYRIECESSLGSELIAIESLITRVKQFPSANKTHVELYLVRRDCEQFQTGMTMQWVNGTAKIPSLTYYNRTRPQYLLKALLRDVEPWPNKIVLVQALEGVNRTLSYTLELLDTAKQCCIRGYGIEGSSQVCIEGKSIDANHTPFFVKLCVDQGHFVLTGTNPKPAEHASSQEKFRRAGW